MKQQSWVTVTRGRRATMFPIKASHAGPGASACVVGPVVFVGCVTDGAPLNLVRMELTLDDAIKLAAELKNAIAAASPADPEVKGE